jgi:hypothetical protein
MLLLILIVVILLAVGGGGWGYYGRPALGSPYGIGGAITLIVVVLLIWFLLDYRF